VLDTDAPRYILYYLGTCCTKLFALGLFELVTAPLKLAEAPAMAMAEVLDCPVCLDSVEEGMRVCWNPMVPMFWPDCLIMSCWWAWFLDDSLAPTSFLCFYEILY